MTPLVSEADHLQLNRLVTEHAWKLVLRRWVELFSRGDVLNLSK
jgi:hypothetical protein